MYQDINGSLWREATQEEIDQVWEAYEMGRLIHVRMVKYALWEDPPRPQEWHERWGSHAYWLVHGDAVIGQAYTGKGEPENPAGRFYLWARKPEDQAFLTMGGVVHEWGRSPVAVANQFYDLSTNDRPDPTKENN